MSDILWATLIIGVRVGLVLVVLTCVAVLVSIFYCMFTKDHYYDYLDREVYDYEKEGM